MGPFLNLEGEQRRETDELIRKNIGTHDDFMSTIISTASNLENLIETKPTERGKILSKFIGLEILENKEKITKEMYSNWNKTLKMNAYNTEELKNENQELNKDNINFNNQKKDDEKHLLNIEKEVLLLEKEKEIYLAQKIEIDETLKTIKPKEIEEQIGNFETIIKEKELLYKQRQQEIKDIGDTDYDIEIYNSLLQKEKELEIKIIRINSDTNSKKQHIKELENSKFCPVCKRAMEDVDHSKEIEEINNKIYIEVKKSEEVGNKLEKIQGKLTKEKKLKSNFDEVEKIKITLSRIEIDKERWKLDIEKKNQIIENYNKNLGAIESNKKIEEKIVDINYRKGKKSLERDQKIN